MRFPTILRAVLGAVIGGACLTAAACGNDSNAPRNTALFVPSDAVIAFDPTVVGETMGYYLAVDNTGSGAAQVAASISGPGAQQFSVDRSASNCLDGPLQPHATCTLAVRFAPAAAGPQSASLQISGAGGALPPIALSGLGQAHVTVLTPDPVAGSVIARDNAGQVLQTCRASSCGFYTTSPVVTLTASPDANGYFGGFSGGGCSGTAPCALAVGAGAMVTAAFALRPETILEPRLVPRFTNRSSGAWAFHSDRADATFECTFDALRQPCTSPFASGGLLPGKHSFSVRAIIDGVPDATPAVDTVTVADRDLLRYPFDADGVNAGGLAPDYRAIVGTASYVAGRYGSAVKFDGSTTGGIRIPGVDTLFTQSNEWTIALWFREDSVVKNTVLFELRATDADGNDRGWETYHGGYPDAMLHTCSAAGCATFAAPVGVWHNIVYRYAAPSISAGGPLEIWFDGALVATLPNANNVPLMTHVSAELRLGYYGPYGSSGQYGKFTVDELRVFDRTFTPAEQCTVVSYGTWNGSSCTVTGM